MPRPGDHDDPVVLLADAPEGVLQPPHALHDRPMITAGVIDSRTAPGGPALITDAGALWSVLRLYREFRRWDPSSAPVAESLTAEALAGLSRPAVCERRPPGWLGDQAHMTRVFTRQVGMPPGVVRDVLRTPRS